MEKLNGDLHLDKNIKLVLAYDGRNYHGWQIQKNGITVQGVLEEKLEQMTGKANKVTASGRTDAGVHALNQVVNYVTQTNIPPESIKNGLNSLLPNDIYVKQAEYVPLDFHARYSAISKKYEYRILNRRHPDIFQRHYLWHVGRPLDTGVMKKSLSMLLGKHDFSCFRSSGSGNTNPIRQITRADLSITDEALLCVTLEADGFLRHMVRNIVGTITEVGLGKYGLDRFSEILKSKDRSLAGKKAPPQGLFLISVRY